MDALVRETKRRKILFFEEVYVTSLTKHNGAVNGAVGFDMFGNDIMLFSSRAVVLAAGGYSNIYSRSGSKAGENTGDAASLAFQAGAELQDMEMVQFHPTGLVWPAKVAGAIVAEAVRAEGGVLYNDKGERFMGRYDRRMELGPRDVVARAVHSEILGGRGSRRKAVWLDFRHREKENIEQQLPSTYRQMLSLGVDISEDLIEVAPTAHYSMGGIRTGVNGETNVPGLYAVGEAVAGLHGANRLGGNLLTEAIVFGRIVGAAAAAAAKQTELNQIDYNEVMEKTGTAKGAKQGKPRPKSVRRLRLSLQNAMSRHAGVVRDQKGLQTALREVEAVKKKIHRARPAAGLNRNFADFWDLCHMTVAAEAVVRSALLRKESRGAHFRADYPVQDDRMMFNIICSNEGGAMKLRTSRVPHPSSELNLLAKVLHEPQRADAE
jgi:succinate dehydrogenase / fumarate reductase flavoprotein subunit